VERLVHDATNHQTKHNRTITESTMCISVSVCYRRQQ